MTSSRLPDLTPETLDEQQRALYASITAGRRAGGPQLFRLVDDDGRLTGPFGVMLLAPGVGRALSALGEAIRYGTSLPARTREIAILVVAARWRSEFEWYAHEPLGRHAGLGDPQLATLRTGAPATFADPCEQAAHDLCFAAVRDGTVDDETWLRAVGELGLEAVTELLTLVGYYAALALLLNAFQVGVPPGGASTFS